MTTYREIAVEQMVLTVEEAMSRVIDWWGDLPPSMKEAIEQFRTELGVAIDSVEFVKKALDRDRRPKQTAETALPATNFEFGCVRRPMGSGGGGGRYGRG